MKNKRTSDFSTLDLEKIDLQKKDFSKTDLSNLDLSKIGKTFSSSKKKNAKKLKKIAVINEIID